MKRGYPNGSTYQREALVYSDERSSHCSVTGRSETSKYTEEQKSTEIPLVAASERGAVQTYGMQKAAAVVPYVFRFTYREFCRVLPADLMASRMNWKVQPEGVKAP